MVGLLLKYRDTDTTPILIRNIRTTSIDGNMLLDHPYQFYLVPTGNCRTKPTLVEAGTGDCTGGTLAKNSDGDNVVGGQRNLGKGSPPLSSDKYMGWVN